LFFFGFLSTVRRILLSGFSMDSSISRRQFIVGVAAAACSPFAGIAAAATDLRVACLDWALTETMMALAHNPIAMVAAGDWDRFVVEPKLPIGIADLGLQPEINFELLVELKPDLILTSPFVQQLEPVLRKIAPTCQFSIFEKGSAPLGQPRAVTLALGERLDCVSAARSFLDRVDQAFDRYRERVLALDPVPLLLLNFIDARHARVYGGAGLYQNVLDRLGLSNAWHSETNYWGFSTVGIERLATRESLRLIVFQPIPPDTLPTLRQSPLWNRLPFVLAGHVSVLPPVLMFGAMPSALRFARLLVEHLENLSE
jgi:iron complex transport system substrate-binding protein